MTSKRKAQISIDVAMTILLPVLMAYSLVGEEAHEWRGMGMFALFVAHNALNAWWHKSVFKGR
jgi:hypothetical protein